MRFYDIQITSKDGKLIQPSYFAGVTKSFATSFVNGQTLPAALNIELDIPLANYSTPRQGAWLRIWGISLAEIFNANQLSSANITIYAGMKKGLPLAKPSQSQGVLLKGTIYQPFGNWIGTDMTLEMTLLPPMGSNPNPSNISFEWKAKQPLSGAITNSLQTAFPGFTVKVSISDSLTQANDQKGYYATLSQFASYILKYTQSSQFAGIKTLSGGKYSGVRISVKEKTILVYDGTANYGAASFDSPTQIAFEDMVGQPTWINPITINIKTVMRSDLAVGDYIQMPKTNLSPYVIATQASSVPDSPSRDKSIFQGKFVIAELHHFGNFRQADGASWVTVINAVSVNPPVSST